MNLSSHLINISRTTCKCICQRSFSASSVLEGRRNKIFPPNRELHPFDDRFLITSKDVSRDKKHGSEWAEQYVEENNPWAPQKPGIKVKKTGMFKVIKEMRPEFIVPDLTDFKLNPYVTYNIDENVHQDEFTAKDLFDATYGHETVVKYKNEKEKLYELSSEEIVERSEFSPK